MGYRLVNGIPVLVPDDLSELAPPPVAEDALPPPRDLATFDAAPTPGVDAPDIGRATVEPPVEVVPPAHPLTLEQRSAAGDFTNPDALSAASPVPPPGPEPVQPEPTGDAGAAIAGAAKKVADVMSGDINLAPAQEAALPPAPEQPPMSPEESRAARQANLEDQWNAYDQAILQTQDPVVLSKLAGEQNVIAEQMKGLALEERASADQAVAAEHDRIRAEAAEAIRRKEEEVAANQRRIENARQRAEHMIAQVEAEAAKPVDRSLGLGTGKSILLAISVALAGLGSALKGQGDKNPALDIVMRAIDKHVEDQWAHKKELWQQADRIAKGMGEFDDKTMVNTKIKEAFKAEALIKASKEMERIAKDLPAAKRAAALEQAAALKAEGVKRRMEIGENTAKWMAEKEKIRETAAQNARQNALERSRVAQGWARIRLDRDQAAKADEHWEKDYELRKQKNDADIKAAERTGNSANLAQLKHERDMLDREIGGLIPEVQMGADGKPLVVDGKAVVGYQPIMEPDPDHPGQMRKWVPNGSTAAIEGFRTTRAQSLKVIQATDRLVQLIKDNGWEPDFLRSDAFLKEHALYAKVILEAKDKYHLGSLQGSGEGGELALMKKFVGTTDPTALARMGDPTAGLREMRAGIQRDLYVDMTGLGYGGPPVEIPEDNDYGERERVQNTPAAGLAAQSEGRLASAPGVDLQTTQTVQDQWNERGPTGFGGKYTGPSARGIPSPEAADAIYKAADIASGRVKGDPEVGRAVLRKIIQSEQHDPVWRLAARLAFENDIDLGVTGDHGVGAYFNKKAYDTARASGSPEVMRVLYGTDPTYGYAGTEAYRKERGQGAGVDAERKRGLVEILRRVR